MSYESKTTSITLPSGPEAVIKEFTGRSEGIITNESLVKQGKMLTSLLTHQLVELEGEKPTESRVQALYTADRRALLLGIRVLSYGPEFSFVRKCNSCKEENEITLNLEDEEDIKWTPMPENVEHEVTLPASGLVATVGPLTGEHETRMAKLGTQDILINSTLMYLRKIEGVSDAKHRSFLNEASARDTQAIRRAAEKVEFGPETQVTFECIHCGASQTAEITNETGFFFLTD